MAAQLTNDEAVAAFDLVMKKLEIADAKVEVVETDSIGPALTVGYRACADPRKRQEELGMVVEAATRVLPFLLPLPIGGIALYSHNGRGKIVSTVAVTAEDAATYLQGKLTTQEYIERWSIR